MTNANYFLFGSYPKCTLTGVIASRYNVTQQFEIFTTPKIFCFAKVYGRKEWEQSRKHKIV